MKNGKYDVCSFLIILIKFYCRFSKYDKENLELLLEEYKSVNDKGRFHLDISEYVPGFFFVNYCFNLQIENIHRSCNIQGAE